MTICTPANNSTVNSPVRITALTSSSKPVTGMHISVDGVQKYQVSASSVDASLPMAAGARRVTVVAKDSTGQYFWSTVNITVSSAVAVTVTPSSAILNSGQSRQFSANVSVTWAVDSIAGGNSAVGTITTAGLYTAPSTTGTHSITATSTADPSRRDTATVQVTSATATCTAKTTNPSVTICTPSNNSSVSSPVRITALTTDSNTVTGMHINVDGVQKYQVASSSLDTQLAMAAGARRITVVAKDSLGRYFWSTVNTTVTGTSAVTVTPSSATLTAGQTQQFSANVSVTWAVDGVTGGNSSVGTITTAGLYTAPGIAGTHSITATSKANSTQRATATVQVQVTDATAPTLVSGSVSPASIDTSEGPSKVELTIEVKDDLSGFNAGFFTLSNSDNSQPNNFQSAHCVANHLSSGTPKDGRFTGTCHFNQYSQAGSFVFVDAYLYDNARRQRRISGDALKSLIPATVQVSSVKRPAPLTISSPVEGASVLSPVHVLASISSRQPVTSMKVLVDGVNAYSASTSAVNTYLNISPGTHDVMVRSTGQSGVVSTATTTVNVLSSGVAVSSPGPNSSVSAPVHLIAAAKSASSITSMQIVVDGINQPSTQGSSINTFLDVADVASGPHHIEVKAFDSAGQMRQSALDIDVQAPPPLTDGQQQYLDLPFQAGVTHIGGRYGFTQKNFLMEGSEKIVGLGSPAIFVGLYGKFRVNYPDKSENLWPATTPANLKALAQTEPYTTLFNMPFKLIVLTAHSFANASNMANFLNDPNAAVKEEQEFYDLALYLYSTYAGSGKTFILKHWEGDQIGLQGASNTTNISPSIVQAMITWLSARQRGVTRARIDAGNPAGVAVFNAVEANRVMDVSRSGLTRVINAVVPAVKPDMVTYSSYDSSLRGSDSAGMAAAMTEALSIIKSFAPDPLGLGDGRILISEYGLQETTRPLETEWRAQTLLETAKAAGIGGAFLWQVYDNECKDSSGNYFPVDTSPGDAIRPVASQCHGLWIYRPDGSESTVLGVLSPYWR